MLAEMYDDNEPGVDYVLVVLHTPSKVWRVHGVIVNDVIASNGALSVNRGGSHQGMTRTSFRFPATGEWRQFYDSTLATAQNHLLMLKLQGFEFIHPLVFTIKFVYAGGIHSMDHHWLPRGSAMAVNE